MSYVIYNSVSGHTYGNTYQRKGSAVNAAHKMNLKRDSYDLKRGVEFIAILSSEYDEKINVMVTRINMMTGLEYQEKLNTPNYCSPASESYWSM
jgi:hypothetical protein